MAVEEANRAPDEFTEKRCESELLKICRRLLDCEAAPKIDSGTALLVVAAKVSAELWYGVVVPIADCVVVPTTPPESDAYAAEVIC